MEQHIKQLFCNPVPNTEGNSVLIQSKTSKLSVLIQILSFHEPETVLDYNLYLNEVKIKIIIVSQARFYHCFRSQVREEKTNT